MYIQNRRNSSKVKSYSPLQHGNILTSLKPALAYFAYTNRCGQFKYKDEKYYNLTILNSFLIWM